MKRALLAGVAVFAMAPAANAASVLIDGFDSQQRAIDVASGLESMFSEINDPSVLGEYRDISASNDNGTVEGTEVRVFNSALAFSNIAFESGEGFLTYDGQDGSMAVNTTGLGGFDLTFGGLGTGFEYEVIQADAELGFTVEAYDMVGGFSSFMTVLPETLTTQTFTGSFDQFMGDADLTNLGALRFIASSRGVPNIDAAIGSISVSIIPLPAGVFLLGGALLGLGAAARRRKAA